jgi:uncharacterized protein (DUF697 family)
MTRKPLPKAIRRPIENLRGIAANFVADEQGRVPREPMSRKPVPFDAVEPEPVTADAPKTITTASPAMTAQDSRHAAPALSPALKAKRRTAAQKIVARHRNYAAVGGLVPLPVVSIASLTAVNMRMVKSLSTLYGVPFQRDRTRSMIVSIVAGAVPAGLGTATSSAMMLIIPGGVLFGMGVSAVSAAALTRAIGLVFVDGFESAAE